MGHGPSVLRELRKSVFADKQLLAGCKYLRDDAAFRASFTSYIKSGDWLEKLTKLPLNLQPTHSNLGGQHSHAIYEYSISDHLKSDLQTFGTNALISEQSDTLSGTPVSQTIRTTSDESTTLFTESIFDIGEFSKFAPEQLITIMFSSLFPLYMESPSYKRFLIDGIGLAVPEGTREESVTCNELRNRGEGPSSLIKRTQKILLACATYFDERAVERNLCTPDWTAVLIEAIDGHPFGISVVEAGAPGQIIVFANRAFTRQTGYSLGELCITNMDILSGPDTELPQLAMYRDAVSNSRAIKVGITRYTKQQKSYIDLMAVRPVGCYSVAVHFVSTRSTNIDDLKTVDDLLILLSHIVKQPDAEERAQDDGSVGSYSWLHSPLTTISRMASSTLSRSRISPSPSQNGSYRSTFSGGGGNSARSHQSHRSGGSSSVGSGGSADVKHVSVRNASTTAT